MPWGRNLDAVIAAIRAGNADIIGLQEVAGVPKARKIADALNMNFVLNGVRPVVLDYPGGKSLSCLPIRSSHHAAHKLALGVETRATLFWQILPRQTAK